ncbi:3'-5' exonuclease [Klebsiella quasipneumoniae]|uniref:3'-5' exonuclease n=1 Tax=Klebsiella quasipneumoniae TaxID=1463165 RepID=UPI0020530E14|nr:3'-5' exonuclease [Klebsiella quasipneumoniae]DAL29246.1 MAG TPA_asm: 3' exoribonuclease [Caudoviricetes sp.]HCL6957409.1 3'-5' exoribonuclease [Klebsiella variicola]HDG7975177.1 3'-5' exoribonuclease [Klebsiella pneumoniae]MDZ1464156.1 3'-5' exoribonuclease [Klebsiella quasipneumoniae]HCQ1484269.1 3'-5' exoribonuclease [Klebsiella quasipneumoniae]
MNNVMLDIRVLGKSPDSPIFAIECVFFEPSTGKIGPGYYRAVDITTVGGIYPEAVLQLMKGDSAQRAEVINATCSAIDAVTGACRFIASTASKHEKLFCWSAGDSLSVAALAHAVSRYNLEPFLPSFEVRNLSTLIHIAGVTGYAPHPRRSKSYVLTDAVYRAEQTCEIWQRLTSPHLESL